MRIAGDAEGIVAALREGRMPTFAAERFAVWVRAANWLIEHGELQAAAAALQALNAASPGLEWAVNVGNLLELAPPLPPGATDFQDDLEKDVQILAQPGAPMALILFCGARHRAGMPLPLLHRWLANLGASVIYLRDFHGLCYLRGVASLGDNLAASVSALQQMLDGLGARQTVCFGGSGGGFGALRYALQLGCDAISLGSPMNMEPEFNEHMNHGEVARMLKTTFPDEDLDLRRGVEAARRPPRTLVVYGERNWNERIHAEHMAGAPGATLYPVAGYSGHATTAELIHRGQLDQMLRDFLDGRPLAAPVA